MEGRRDHVGQLWMGLPEHRSTNPRILVTGATGQLGSHVIRQLRSRRDAATDGDAGDSRCFDSARTRVLALSAHRECPWHGVERACVNLAEHDRLAACVREFAPTHVLHLGAMTVVSDAFAQPAMADCVNTLATAVIGRAAAAIGARMIYTSTDMVFDGEHAPYAETATPIPPSYYGRTKLAGEEALTRIAELEALTVRVPLMFGFIASPSGVPPRETTFSRQIDALRRGAPLRLFHDEYRTPVWVGDAAAALIGLAGADWSGLPKGESGGRVIHVSGPKRMSRLETVQEFARVLGIENPQFISISRLDIESPEPRPRDLSLDGSLFARLFPRLAPGPIRAIAFERS